MTKRITPKEAKNILSKGGVLIDVRTKAEFNSSHIKDSINIDLGNIKESIDKIKTLDNEIIFVCRTGQRASKACDIIRKDTNSKHFMLTGGLLAWKEQGFETIDSNSMWDIERQARITVGVIVLLFSVLGLFNKFFLIIPIFMSIGLIYAAISNSCLLGMIILKIRNR